MKEELEKKEKEEYNQWSEMFAVEETGENQIDESKQLDQLVEKIKKEKVVEIELLSGEFQMSSKQILEKIKLQEELGVLSGVLDDRGKYIYITPQELQKIAEFINTKGRIDRAGLREQVSKFINLEGSQDDSGCQSLLKEMQEDALK